MATLLSIWPWYVVGPLLGAVVPLLLLTGNKALGISSTLRHICAAALPAKIQFLTYDWKAHSWQMLFAAGLVLGGLLGHLVFSPAITSGLIPNPHSPQEWLTLLGGGFLVGFGTRWAGGAPADMASSDWPICSGPRLLQWQPFLPLAYSPLAFCTDIKISKKC